MVVNITYFALNYSFPTYDRRKSQLPRMKQNVIGETRRKKTLEEINTVIDKNT